MRIGPHSRSQLLCLAQMLLQEATRKGTWQGLSDYVAVKFLDQKGAAFCLFCKEGPASMYHRQVQQPVLSPPDQTFGGKDSDLIDSFRAAGTDPLDSMIG